MYTDVFKTVTNMKTPGKLLPWYKVCKFYEKSHPVACDIDPKDLRVKALNCRRNYNNEPSRLTAPKK